MGYKYYDSPEGQDCLKKMWYTTKTGALIGLGLSSFDVIMYSRPKGYFPTLMRYGYITLPIMGMAASFSATTCIATNARGKDGKLNYFLGGCAAGGVFGAWRRSIFAGFLGCVALGGFAVAKKLSIEEGWEFIGKPPGHIHGSLRGVRQDWTITDHRPGNWKVSE
ncbi:NADH dehydrogenase [ubiquinone] 1 alpha subcomplex subunit 11 [Schistocerca piceifrons]|uniref:NADH dehydrogenase [ubiquinone] 1 alpha subcomplex subunit 11 n=1 Tax=Schistocerca piceifrons TaxID=274613 RepID=UPI001F5F892C|nr:NADH dehydrogenase [ubiquinone] 1 alpha subcomplex subunit 11 [Schistocerca piceifrons]